jgi:hypothetical protein
MYEMIYSTFAILAKLVKLTKLACWWVSNFAKLAILAKLKNVKLFHNTGQTHTHQTRSQVATAYCQYNFFFHFVFSCQYCDSNIVLAETVHIYLIDVRQKVC